MRVVQFLTCLGLLCAPGCVNWIKTIQRGKLTYYKIDDRQADRAPPALLTPASGACPVSPATITAPGK